MDFKKEFQIEFYMEFKIDFEIMFEIIVEKENWPLFEHSMGMGEQAKSAIRTKWLRELSDIRNKAMHPERGLLNKEETARIQEISEHCNEKLN